MTTRTDTRTDHQPGPRPQGAFSALPIEGAEITDFLPQFQRLAKAQEEAKAAEFEAMLYDEVVWP